MAQAVIALGSNLDGPAEQVSQALRELAGLPKTRLVESSRLYRTAPVGPTGQPDYCNAVAIVETELDPASLLTRMHGIEDVHGRRRVTRWGARTLDLDLLCHADVIRKDPDLTLPHPRIAERAFVLEPWNEIAPEQEVPGLGTVGGMLRRVDRSGVVLWAGQARPVAD